MLSTAPRRARDQQLAGLRQDIVALRTDAVELQAMGQASEAYKTALAAFNERYDAFEAKVEAYTTLEGITKEEIENLAHELSALFAPLGSKP